MTEEERQARIAELKEIYRRLDAKAKHTWHTVHCIDDRITELQNMEIER